MPRRCALIVTVVLLATGVAGKHAAADVPHLLVFSGTYGFRHLSIPYANAVLDYMARSTGAFTVEFTEDPSFMTAETLAGVDVVVWNNTTGNSAPFTAEQEAAYVRWLSCGGGHIGVHASADSYKDWPEWLELTGAFIRLHPLTPTSIADDRTPEYEGWGEPEAEIVVADAAHPAAATWAGRDSFRRRDEYYAWDRDPAAVVADFHPILAFGGFTNIAEQVVFGGFYPERQPLSWSGTFRGLDRLFYTNLGHSASTWNNWQFQEHLVGAIGWVSEVRPDPACLT